MAQADEHPTLDSEWPLLSVVVAFVAHWCKGVPAAKALILEYARNGHFTEYRFESEVGLGPSARRIDPRHWSVSHPETGLYIRVDFECNTVTYIRGTPASYTFTLALEDRLERFLGPPLYQIRLVRLF